MTSLIDVIFLLLLFFMLTSTFTRFAEIELTAAAGAPSGDTRVAPLFLQLGPSDVRLNGNAVPFDALPAALARAAGGEDRTLLVSLADDVTAQRLTDLLVALRDVPRVTPTLMGAS